jgi:hypothetical protein
LGGSHAPQGARFFDSALSGLFLTGSTKFCMLASPIYRTRHIQAVRLWTNQLHPLDLHETHQITGQTIMKTHPKTPLAQPQPILGIVAGLLLLMASTASAESIFPIGSWPGYTRYAPYQVVGGGATAYLVSGAGLQIFNLSSPLQPEALSFLPCFTPYVESPTDIYLQGESNRLCIGVGVSYSGYTNLLKGIDVSDLTNPVHVWSGKLYHQPNQVCLDGHHAYSSHNTRGLRESTWGAVGYGVEVSSVTNAWGRVVFEGDRLYVPTISGFQVFNKTNRSLLGTFAAGAEGKALAVSGHHAYLAATDGLRIVDVQNATTLSQIGFLALSASEFEPTDVQLLTDHACLIFKKTNLLMVVDVSIPTAPMSVGSYGFAGPTKDLSVNDERALVLAADNSGGSADLHVLDLSTPADPTLVSRLYAAGQSASLALQDSTLYVADGGNGLCVFDVETPSTPQIIGQQVTAGSCMAVANDLAILGDFAGFSVFNVSDPENPVLITNSWEPAIQLQAVGDYLYRIGSWPLLTITDVRNNFAEIGRLDWIPGVNQVSAFSMVGDQFALLVDTMQPRKLFIIDVQTAGFPTNIIDLIDTEITDMVSRAGPTGTNAFLATTNGLEILDLSDTNNIASVRQWDCPAGFVPSCICIDGDRIGLASANHLWILDINELGGGEPVIAETAIPSAFSDMMLSGNHLYAAAGADGVIVYQIGSTPAQPTLFIAGDPPAQVNLDWSAAGTGWWLQQSVTPADPESWEILPGSDTVTGTNLARTAPAQFFRLISQ